MPVPGPSLLGLKRIRGFVSILRYINPTVIIIWGVCHQLLQNYIIQGNAELIYICLHVFKEEEIS